MTFARPRLTAAVFSGLVLLAAALRLPNLATRPMHADEAVNADKFGILLEQGQYSYSAQDFHGPALAYLTLLPARLQGLTRYVDLTEVTLRLVAAFAGVLLVGGHFLLEPHLGLPSAAAAGLFTAVSPCMVYYSRDYIHEMLMVFFTFGLLLSLLGYSRTKRASWAISAGVCLGLMYATKETVVLAVVCMALAGAAAGFRKFSWRHLAMAAAAAVMVALVLMSSFFTHPQGVIDSLKAYITYLQRGAGVATAHTHPWYSYFQWLLYFHRPGKPLWTEGLIAALALLGLWRVFRGGPKTARFLALYTVLMVLAYSAMPYKAPWNLLSFWHGAILMAGVGSAWLVAAVRGAVAGAVVVVLLVVGVQHLGWLAWQGATRFGADPANPWVYAQTGTDVFRIVHEVESVAAADARGKALPVQVIGRTNFWPLPWYLRRFTGVRWSAAVSDSVPSAPLILATPDMEPALLHKIYDLPPPGEREMYVPLFDRYTELRPQVELRGYLAKTLWDEREAK